MMRSLSLYYVLFCFVLCCNGQTSSSILTDTAPPPSASFPASWYPPYNDAIYTVTELANSLYTAMLITTTRYRDQSTLQTKTFSQSTFQARDAAGQKRDELRCSGLTVTEEPSFPAKSPSMIPYRIAFTAGWSHGLLPARQKRS